MSSEPDKEAGVPAQARVHAFAEGRAGAFRSAFASLFAPCGRGSLRLAGAQPGTPPRPDPNSTYAEADFADLIAESPAAGFVPKPARIGGCDTATRPP